MDSKTTKSLAKQLRNDNRMLPLSKPEELYPQIAVAALVKIPLIVLSLPVVFINKLVDNATKSSAADMSSSKRTSSKRTSSKRSSSKRTSSKRTSSKRMSVRRKIAPPVPVDVVPFKDRKYDIVLFGVTGFTGRLGASYVAKQYGDSISWAIAGRSQAKLKDILKELERENPEIKGKVDIIVADSSDVDSLPGLVRDTRVLASSVGPFLKYGMPVVAHCAAYGTSYSDTTGETDFVRSSINHLSETARESGARIVHFCGNDCVPYDLVAMKLAQDIKNKSGQDLKSVRLYDELVSQASGGTLSTVINGMTGEKHVDKTDFDPLLRLGDGSKSSNVTKNLNPSGPGYAKERKLHEGISALGNVNAACFKRTNALLNLGENVTYRESKMFPNAGALFVEYVGMLFFGVMVFSSWIRSLAMALNVIPKPGQGASKEFMENVAFLRVIGFGTGVDGATSKVNMYFPRDPGYLDTARMMIESGLCVALESDRVFKQVEGGVYTPASGLGDVLLERLLATGTEFEVME